MKKIIPVVLLLLICHLNSWAQQQPQFTQYGFNGMYISPAYAGITNRPEIQSIYRYQWLNYDASFDDGGSPRTLLLTAHTPVRLLKGGLGITLMQDQIANTRIQQAAISYSFHLKVGEGKLGIGLQGNINNIRKGSYRFIDEGDPNIPFNSSDSKFDMGAGVWYESEQFYAGAGVTNLLGSSYQFMNVDNTEGGRVVGENHLYLTGGYHLPLTNQLVLTPTALLKHDTETFSFDAGARITFDEKYWGGLNFRHQEAVSALVGIAMLQDNALRVGYALDLTTFNKEAKAPTSHEVMVSYRLPEPVVRFRPPVRTPRYNFTK
ncbi:type IX secretion system membrane protein PorP/SprF [Pontibacter sp. HSC-36F09]|uniref:PorP/SprF family type IX secretion system membrane protein n=1 Tax=Pontibacter sp. HSC-36F09 TaxID=2910966 RepID=UPI00209F75B8|nr:type IX secretion system membrane protein PorP/SprF [Pontibacter sp. HSC-36F09]MCP2043153.1 type IX secretion system PorP/SprF family membrane protein [Pontibacter sp. HSC-36F09]